ncbi:methionine gamma-lyase family protein [Alkalibacter mobilis]|uniref:methionine gamma-lyase family protein n=1 Tax=Alkalibacter mobilis TaxID=2787712 RepID=UPI00189E7F0C|nr:methionine gamma-lyase family protein [Alkalibacter mobilis]MBF7097620.1 methionine gamma-lyase family protein [Alkalibacter mobilis]
MSVYEDIESRFGFDGEIVELCRNEEQKLEGNFRKLMEISEYNQFKVIRAMQRHNLGDRHFSVSTGYGYNDEGREILEKIYSDVFNTEDALVRPQIISGTHAISIVLFGILRPGDELVSITGAPYDTIRTVIGWENMDTESYGTLKDYKIGYGQIEMNEDGIDIEKALERINEKTKMVYIQRSTGYSWRKALTVDEIGRAVLRLKERKPDLIVMVDNCYGEFIEKKEPTDVGVDIMAGSLIKNPGGGIAPMGGYVAGKSDLVYKAACRLAAPGIAKETGATMGINRNYLQGLFLAPSVVSQALKTAMLAASVFSKLGYEVCPSIDGDRSDIIQSIKFGDREKVKIFCRGIQAAAPVDSFVVPEPWDMPGYDDEVIMAAGAFYQGSSIELSADAPMREPYIAYLQGGLTYEHGKMGLYSSIAMLKDKDLLYLQ